MEVSFCDIIFSKMTQEGGIQRNSCGEFPKKNKTISDEVRNLIVSIDRRWQNVI